MPNFYSEKGTHSITLNLTENNKESIAPAGASEGLASLSGETEQTEPVSLQDAHFLHKARGEAFRRFQTRKVSGEVFGAWIEKRAAELKAEAAKEATE